MNNTSNIRSVIIVGSGPAGLTAALYSARAELKPLVIAGLNPGGQLMQTTEVENFPGFVNGIQGPELMDNMMKQVKRFGAEILMENVVSVDFSARPFKVKTEKTEYFANSVIVATGAEANWLGLPNEQRLRGKGVSACATCDGFFFKGKDVVVIGGGDTAMEEANFLTRFTNKVIIVHRRDEFRASKIMVARAKANSKIEFVTNVTVTDVLGENVVEGVKVKHNQTGQEKIINAQGYFSAIGHTPNTKLFAAAGIETDDKGYIKVKNFTNTNIEGVFVAGDVNDPRYRQAIVAAGWGCMASLDSEKYLESLEDR
jgi:thioredoxin reductase (NADPH)